VWIDEVIKQLEKAVDLAPEFVLCHRQRFTCLFAFGGHEV
jgi:hypothetical protein